MNKFFLTLTMTLFFGAFSSEAQIAIAVAKDNNGSSLEWIIVWNEGYKTESIARKKLKDKGYQKVTTLTGGADRGHTLKSGYWVVVESRRKNYNGTMKTSFGLGASSNSYGEAEKRAVSNLGQYDWGWNKKHGYSIAKKGTFN